MAKTKFTPVSGQGAAPLPNDPAFRVPVYPIFYEDHQYKPPQQKLKTREEAIFLLAYCGHNALEVPIHLIRAFSYVFSHRDRIQKNGHSIICNFEASNSEWILKNTGALVKKWMKKKPTIFSSLPKMAGWLQYAYGLSGDTQVLSRRCTQQREYESIVRTPYEKLNPKFLDELADELAEISDYCNRRWRFHTYLKLFLQHAESVKNSTCRSTSELSMKKHLRDRLKSNDLYDVCIPYFLENSPDEWELDKCADTFINGIREVLENDNITIFNIIEKIQRILGTSTIVPVNAISISNQLAVSSSTKPHTVTNSRSTKIAENFLKNDRYFSREFFIWFCIAYVEVNLASIKDSKTSPKKIINWTIYLKMRELNGGSDIGTMGQHSNESEKKQKERACSMISHCKSRFRENKLPARKRQSSLNEKEVVRCIKFFQKIPEIAKLFTCTTFTQHIVNKIDAK